MPMQVVSVPPVIIVLMIPPASIMCAQLLPTLQLLVRLVAAQSNVLVSYFVEELGCVLLFLVRDKIAASHLRAQLLPTVEPQTTYARLISASPLVETVMIPMNALLELHAFQECAQLCQHPLTSSVHPPLIVIQMKNVTAHFPPRRAMQLAQPK